MAFSLVSINYKHAPLALRERLAVSPDEMAELLDGLKTQCGLTELMVISTCNRVEFYQWQGDSGESSTAVLDWVKRRHPGLEGELEECAVALTDQAALMHLFRVGCSLESMVIGEPQILGQVKEGYRAAREHGSVGPYINGLMPKVFHAAKRVRTETGIARFPVSISQVAADLAGQIFDSLTERTVMVIGAGEMAELVIRHLQKAGVRRLLITNRTFATAVALAERFQGDAVRFEHLESNLAAADIVISSTGAPGFIIGEEEARAAQKARKGKPMFFIDIAVPRDVHPDVNELSNVYCYDVDDLQAAATANHREREEEGFKAQQIVEEEVHRFLRWREADSVAPVITALRGHFQETGASEVEKTLARLKHLSKSDAAAVRKMVDGLLKKLLHAPSTHLKQLEDGEDRLLHAEAVARAFGLNPHPADAPSAQEPGKGGKVVQYDFGSKGQG